LKRFEKQPQVLAQLVAVHHHEVQASGLHCSQVMRKDGGLTMICNDELGTDCSNIVTVNVVNTFEHTQTQTATKQGFIGIHQDVYITIRI
jgi:hypothetical protein